MTKKATGTHRSSTPNPDPFPYEDYLTAQNALATALTGSRFYLLLTGGSGMGKTSLVHDIPRDHERHRHQLLYLPASRASITGIARVMAIYLHVTPRRSFLENMHILTEAIRAQCAHLVIWIDEADRLDMATLIELRMLAEADIHTRQTFSLVLSGMPQLITRLDAPDLFSLRRRIDFRLRLTGLRRHELDPFICHRFGEQDAMRVPESIKNELFERTQATPALIDRVVGHTLFASARGTGDIDEDTIRTTFDTLGL